MLESKKLIFLQQDKLLRVASKNLISSLSVAIFMLIGILSKAPMCGLLPRLLSQHLYQVHFFWFAEQGAVTLSCTLQNPVALIACTKYHHTFWQHLICVPERDAQLQPVFNSPFKCVNCQFSNSPSDYNDGTEPKKEGYSKDNTFLPYNVFQRHMEYNDQVPSNAVVMNH